MTAAHEGAEPIQVHSGLGRLLYVLASLFFFDGLAGLAAAAWFSYETGKFSAAILLMVYQSVPTFVISIWARRHRGPIWVTPSGLAFGTPTELVSWRDIREVKLVPLMSVLQPFYMVSFKDRRVPLPFYANDDVERIVARFRS